MVKRTLGLLVISMPVIAFDSPIGSSTFRLDVRNTLRSNVDILQAELATLNWLHPKRIRLNRRLAELQSRLKEFE